MHMGETAGQRGERREAKRKRGYMTEAIGTGEIKRRERWRRDNGGGGGDVGRVRK